MGRSNTESRRAVVGTSNNKYVMPSSTHDELLDGVKYPLQRLERDPSNRSEIAAIVAQEDERMRRLNEKLQPR